MVRHIRNRLKYSAAKFGQRVIAALATEVMQGQKYSHKVVFTIWLTTGTSSAMLLACDATC